MIQRLLLLPGMHGTGDLFLDFIRALPGSIRSDAPSYPTDRPLNYQDLKRLIREFAPSNEPFVLLAESFSTPLAIAYAALLPANLKGLILCAGFATSPLKGWKQTVVAAIIPVLPLSSFPGRLIQAFLLERGASETLTRNVRAAIRRVKPGVLRHRLKFVLACDEREALRQICVPILYLRPSDDRLVPSAALDEILRFKPETEVVEVAGPHLLLQVNPKAAAEAVAQFLVQVGGEGAGAMR